MKRIIGWGILIILLVTGVSAWLVFGSSTSFSEAQRYFIVEQGQTDKAAVLTTLKENGIVSQTLGLSMLGTVSTIWPKIKPAHKSSTIVLAKNIAFFFIDNKFKD